ncbi:phosphoribosyl-ATP diphosphatase [Polymorphum gilvum]|uniref:Phosphoribosyl-ATP pyrophosphatase n=1 Tax=Polymorphum gilvum (strain LMG 25793 / CGMCC 1.9160 / SL003B-26A1) TaxID=991905 RepID=F2IYE0_POLGS|nr:phosphoribosyl-ATP diphosphatase [Polymorphum gilvum]ADZ68453.1 Phosphoribosyl-ATP pyrophosphatase [Polymorphum gilvum SL003B-26A1]
MTDFTLADLDAIVAARAASDDEASYTRKLVTKGVAKCAQKLGEEAVEAAIAAVAGDRAGLKGEAADLLYHLLVVLRVSGVGLDEVMAELAARTGRTGLEEKASRPAD